MYLINIRGTNGSGKSTIPIQAISQDPKHFMMISKKNPKIKTIVCPTEGFVLCGNYSDKSGGADGLGDKFNIMATVLYACRFAKKHGYDVILEGVIVSTVFSTYHDFFQRLDKDYEIQPVVIFLTTPLSRCLKQLYCRNGNKPVNEEQVKKKRDGMIRQVNKWRESTIPVHLYRSKPTSAEQHYLDFRNFLKEVLYE